MRVRVDGCWPVCARRSRRWAAPTTASRLLAYARRTRPAL